MYYKKTSLEKYFEIKTKINKFVLDKQWLNTLLFDSLISEEVSAELSNIVKTFNKSVSNKKLDLILLRERKKSLDKLKDVGVETDIVSKWKKAREAYAYYGINEVITEGSIFSESLIKSFKDKYGKDYLTIVQQIDKEKPSVLTNFEKKKSLIKYEDLEKRYLILKKWQDDQNIYHEKQLYPVFCDIRDSFSQFYDKKFGKVDTGSREKLVLNELRNLPLISIDMISNLIDIGFEEELVSVVGGKAYGLACLKNLNINIPKTFVIPIGQEFSESVLKELLPNKKYAVRSSADVEDGEKNSFAGMFESVLNVNIDKLNEKVNYVKDSVSSERLNTYIKKFHLRTPQMAVVIQEFCDAVKSGVFMGKDINSGMLEWTDGTGDNLVLGKVVPNLEIHPNFDENSLLSKTGKVGDILLKYQKEIGKLCDFEWCLDDDNNLIMLQFRPVTTQINSKNVENAKENKSLKVINGTAASEGYTEGKICYLEDEKDIDKFEKNSILLTYFTDPNWVEVMTKAKGIITSYGGFLCHTAIIARELGIPCITGIGDENLEKLSKEDFIEMDATKGTIVVKK